MESSGSNKQQKNTSGLRSRQKKTTWCPVFFIVVAFVGVAFFHVWQLQSIPHGIFWDEASTGYNALRIAENGQDEYGSSLPLFFQSFGDFKSPFLIYTLSLLFLIFKASVFLLRLPSALFALATVIGCALMANRLWKNEALAVLYMIIATGFLPWFFVPSRVAFAVNTQVTFLIFGIYFLHRTYHSNQPKLLNAVCAGVCFGLSAYSYNTSKLLTPLYFCVVGLLYFRRQTLRMSVLLTASFVISLLPHIVFSLKQPTALTSRFNTITYVFDEHLPLYEKCWQFVTGYFSHWSPQFLLLNGDIILRHSSGFGGVLFWIVCALAIVGVGSIVRSYALYRDKFALLLLCILVLSPIAAALTNPNDMPHALRSITMGLMIVIISGYGFHALLERSRTRIYRLFPVIVLSVLFLESSLFLHDYFTQFPERSMRSFESYDMQYLLEKAVGQHPSKIYFSPSLAQGFTFHPYRFYREIYTRRTEIPILVLPISSLKDMPKTDTCFILTSDEISALLFAPTASTTDKNYWRLQLRCFQ